MFEPYLLRFTFNNCYYEKIGNYGPVKLEDLPFDIPDSWTWIRLKDLIHIQTGASFKKEQSIQEAKSGFVRVLRGGNILPFQFLLKNDDLYIPQELVSNDILLRKNDLITPAVTSLENIGKIAVITNDLINVTAGGFVYIFRPYIDDEILSNLIADYVSSSAYQSMMKDITKKSGQAFYNMNKEKLLQLYFPIAPFAEMIRIVHKVKKCEPLIDKYSLIEEKFSILEEEFPEKIKKSILQYAIEGKLVKQDPNDEPASVLLERIKAEKENLIKEGKIKRDKNESYIFQGDDKNYYENLPENWCFVPLGSLGTLTRGSGIKRSETVNNGYPCIRYGELYTTYNTSFVHAKSFIPKELYDRSHKIKTNDVVMSLTGENKEDISKGLAYLGLNEIAMGGNMACFSHHKMNPLYLVYLLNSPYGISIKRQLATGDIIVHMSNDRLSSIGIPVPPLNEQERICERIMSICRLID